MSQHPVDGLRHLAHILGPQPPLTDPGRAQPDATGISRRLIPRNGVLVAHQPAQIQDPRRRIALEPITCVGLHGTQVHDQQMGIRSPIGQLQAQMLQALRQSAGVLHDAELQVPESPRPRDLEGHRHGSELVHMRTTLLPREDSLVDSPGPLRIGGEYHGSARPAEGLVRGKSDDVGVPHRAGVCSGDHHSRRMGDIRQQDGAAGHGIDDPPEPSPVHRPRVRGESCDDHSRTVFDRQSLDRVVVQPSRRGIHHIRHGVIPLPRAVEPAPMCEMASMRQGHPHHRPPRLHEGLVDGVVGRRPR